MKQVHEAPVELEGEKIDGLHDLLNVCSLTKHLK